MECWLINNITEFHIKVSPRHVSNQNIYSEFRLPLSSILYFTVIGQIQFRNVKNTEHKNRILRCTMHTNTQSIYRYIFHVFVSSSFTIKQQLLKIWTLPTRQKCSLINKYITTKLDEHLKYLQKNYNFISQIYTLQINVQIALKHELNISKLAWEMYFKNKKFSYLAKRFRWYYS